MNKTTKTLAILAFTALSACALTEDSANNATAQKAANRAACLSEGNKEETDAFIQCMLAKSNQSSSDEDMKQKLKAERDIRDKLKEHERYRTFNY
jgi:thioredoxin-related protein